MADHKLERLSRGELLELVLRQQDELAEREEIERRDGDRQVQQNRGLSAPALTD